MVDKVRESVGEITITGTAHPLAGVSVLIRDAAGNALLATGATVPADTNAGFAAGCIFLQTDGTTPASGSGAILNINVGTPTSSNFDPAKA